MTYITHIRRAELLIAQKRFELAEQTLRAAIAAEPEESLAYALLALTVAHQKDYEQAQRLASRAISLSPADAYGHYVLAVVQYERGQLSEATASIETAIQFEPTRADFHAMNATIKLRQKRWREALSASETGLQFEPEHVDCTNCRAIALTKLGRRDEAGIAILSALAADPEDAETHANMGWTLLHGGDPRKATEHFKESLRLAPGNAWAREGIVESLKARNIFYRWVLHYMLWLSSFTVKTQMLLFVGIIIGIQLMVRLPESGPIQIAGICIALAYFLFVLTMWMASPIFNLLLRFDRFGRLVLTDEQRADTNWLAAALIAEVVLLSGPLWTGFRVLDVITYGMLLLPTGVTLSVPRTARRKLAASITIGAFAVAACYWFRWYVYTGLPIDVLNHNELSAFLDDEPKEKNPALLLQLGEYIKSQSQLKSLFYWPAVGMTWFSATFHKTAD